MLTRALIICGLAALVGAAPGCSDDAGLAGTVGGDAADGSEADDTAAGEDTAPAPDTAPAEPDTDAPPPSGLLSIASVEPDRGLASGGEQVEIRGTGFRDGVQVFFAESLATDVYVLDGQRLVAFTPPRLPGLVDVRLVEPSTEQSATLEAAYLFFNPVEILAIDPPSGHVKGGEPFTLTGTGFLPGSNVLVGGRAAIAVDVVDDGTLVAVTPDAPGPGAVDVHVSNTLGVGRLEDGYTYFDTPSVASVVPAVGPVAGGVPVEVRGGGFTEPLLVTFGNVPLADAKVVAADRVRGVLPAGAGPGPVDVVVSTGYGVAVGEDAFTYLEDLAPGDAVQILAVTPPAGPAKGGNVVTVVAKGLTSAADTEVRFGGAAGKVKGVDAQGHVVLVEVPPGAVGPVDVTLTNANGSDTRAGGYTYAAFVKVYEVLPNFGPTAGGTAVTVSGEGFGPGAQLRVGALPATDVVVVDGGTLTGVTPPGSPGLANVTVTWNGLEDTLYGGFAYQAAMDLWVVTPDQGSQAGGTQITLSGSGFPADAGVLVGGKPATHVKVASPTQITARTPPGAVGTVDVTVTSAAKGVVTLPSSYTYFDPESVFGGTWGNEVDGSVNVTVLSGADGSPIADAFVMLWTDPTTPYQGFTNGEGQITFSGPDLEGEQMVSASKEGFASASVVEYDATNITLYLIPTALGSGPPPPGLEPPLFVGQVINTTKYVPVPWGQCSQKGDAPGKLCDPCGAKADCEGLECSEIPNQTFGGTKFCTSHCATSDDCPDGFMCFPLNGVEEHQCVPSAGKVTAFCDFTKPTILSTDYLEPPGQQVEDDFTFQMTVPIGETAVFCWGGILDPDIADPLSAFTPYALGLARHVQTLPGDVIVQDIVLNHPLNGSLSIRLDDPPNNPNGPNFNFAFVHLDLGSDGTLEFLDHPFGFGEEPMEMPRVPKVLSGDLYDASYTILAGAFSYDTSNLPYSLTLHTGLRDLEDDTFYVWEDGAWAARSTGVTQNVNGLAGVAGDQVVGVGTDGLVIRSVGTAWASQSSGTKKHLHAVHALPTGEAIAVGDDGTATHFDGLTWTVKPLGTTADLEGVWMASPTDAFAVGFYTVQRWNGVEWTTMTGNTSKNLRGVWGFTSDDVWAVGNYGNIIRWNGTAWATVPAATTINLRAAWGASPDDVWIVGEGGLALHWDGTALTPVDTGTTRTLEAVWGTGPNDVVAVGARGTILRWTGTAWVDESPPGHDAAFLAVGGTAQTGVVTGTHELLLGPMLEVPENLDPGDGGVMGESYEVSWTVQEGVQPHFSFLEISVPGLMGPIPEWQIINDWDVTSVSLPDFPNIEGTPGISPGTKIMTLIRVYKEGFDIDNYSNQDLNLLRWRSWAMDQVTFTKQ